MNFDIVRTPRGRFVKAEEAAAALNLAAEVLGRADKVRARLELLSQIEKLCADGRPVPAQEVAELLCAAVRQLGRAGNWTDTEKLAYLARQLERE